MSMNRLVLAAISLEIEFCILEALGAEQIQIAGRAAR